LSLEGSAVLPVALLLRGPRKGARRLSARQPPLDSMLVLLLISSLQMKRK